MGPQLILGFPPDGRAESDSSHQQTSQPAAMERLLAARLSSCTDAPARAQMWLMWDHSACFRLCCIGCTSRQWLVRHAQCSRSLSPSPDRMRSMHWHDRKIRKSQEKCAVGSSLAARLTLCFKLSSEESAASASGSTLAFRVAPADAHTDASPSLFYLFYFEFYSIISGKLSSSRPSSFDAT